MWLSLCWRASAARSGRVSARAPSLRVLSSRSQISADRIGGCTVGGHISRSPGLSVFVGDDSQ